MKASNAHLTVQFDANRITGTEYATVYLGSMQAAMAQAVQYILGEQAADKQADLLAAQIVSAGVKDAIENAQSTQDLLNKAEEITASTAKTLNDTTMRTEQVTASTAKTTREDSSSTAQTNLLIQKTATELGQTTGTISATGVSNQAGTIARQQELLYAQKEGFKRDAEQKITKMMMDNYAVRRSTNDAEIVHPSFDEANIDAIVTKAAAGIDVTLT